MPTSKNATLYRGSSRVSKLALGSVQLWPALTKTRYYDSSPTIARIRASETLTEVTSNLQNPMSGVYDFNVIDSWQGNSDSFSNGVDSWDGVSNDDFAAAKRMCIVLAEELAKYPPLFWVQQSQLESITLGKNLTRNINGAAPAKFAGISRASWTVIDVNQVEPDIRRVVHHELAHLWSLAPFNWNGPYPKIDAQMMWANEIRPRWITLNSYGSYITPYAMTDPAEDIAETMAYMMTDHLQPYILSRAATEQGIAGKVALLREFLSRLDSTMGASTYWNDVVVGR
jgi:hypothetical protein